MSRYRTVQDPREPGLGLLRAQYEALAAECGVSDPAQIHLAWGDVMDRKADERQLHGLPPGVSFKITGPPKAINALATVICRAVSLGWLMLNELEPADSEDVASS